MADTSPGVHWTFAWALDTVTSLARHTHHLFRSLAVTAVTVDRTALAIIARTGYATPTTCGGVAPADDPSLPDFVRGLEQ